MSKAARFLSLCALAALFGCGGNGTNRNQSLVVAGFIRKAEGGSLSKLGQVMLAVPPGALPVDMTVQIHRPSSLPVAPSNLAILPGTAYTIVPLNTPLSQDATLAIDYDPTSLPAGSDASTIRMYRLSGGTWVQVDTTLNQAANRVIAEIDRFGTYAALITK